MQPPDKWRGRPGKAASVSSLGVGGHDEHSRLVAVDPTTIRALSACVPCPMCTHGLCARCWVVARAVAELVVAARVDQATDDPWAVAA